MRIIRICMRYLFPIVLLIILVSTLLFTNNTATIKKVDPKYFIPGEAIHIIGDKFGENRNGNNVYINQRALTQSEYLEWSNQKIVIRAPMDIHNSVIQVHVDGNISNEALITNSAHITLHTPQAPEIQITSHTPTRVSGGDIVTLNGIFSGYAQLRIYFPIQQDVQLLPLSDAGDTNPTEQTARTILYELEEENYIQRSIHAVSIRLPSGIRTGNIYIQNSHTARISYPLKIDSRIGHMVYHSPQTHALNYGAYTGNTIGNYSVWMPRIPKTIAQPQQVPLFTSNYFQYAVDNNIYFYINSNTPGVSMPLRMSVSVSRFAQNSVINRGSLVPSSIESEHQLTKYLRDTEWTAVNSNAAIAQVSPLMQIANFYLRALAIYRQMISQLSPHANITKYITHEEGVHPQSITPSHIDNILRTLSSATEYEAHSAEYALLYLTLLRTAGIPSRIMTGVYIENEARIHYWNEFFLPGFGWIPVDAAMGDHMFETAVHAQDTTEEFYFGNIDNNRVLISKDIHTIPKYHSENHFYSFDYSYLLFNHHIETNEMIDINSSYLYPVVLIN